MLGRARDVCVSTADMHDMYVLEWFAGAPHCPSGPSEFACTDYVCVNLDQEVFQLMQQGHGGWNPAMDNV